MTSRLSVFLLGPLEVRFDGEPLGGFEYNKVRALLAYLGVEANQPHTRASLCTLLWSDMPESAARQNLSQALTQLRKVLGDKQAATPYLLTTTEDVQLNPAAQVEIDVSHFRVLISEAEAHTHRGWRLCSSCAVKLRQAIGLYRGDFLANFYVSDSVVFEEWALLLRERLRQQMLSALERLVQYTEWRGAYDQAVEIARRLNDLQPLHDSSQRELMRLLSLSGQRSAALAQYEHFQRSLAAELDLVPEGETMALYEMIRLGEKLDSLRRFQPPASLIPEPPTRMIGRAADLGAIGRLLEEGAHLLTIIGPPGVGKTRLAVEMAQRMRFDFEEGVHFVELAPVLEAEQVPSAVAKVLELEEQPGRTLAEGIHAYLQPRHILLVLDNFEHVAEAAPFVARLLAACPALTLVVTSRAPLRIRAEQQYVLEPLVEAESVQLFMERARAVRAGLDLNAENSDAIVTICRRLDNLPLGIELVAMRARSFSPVDLLKQLGTRLQTKIVSSRDFPERQSTLRNAIAWSYDRLSTGEQIVFLHLAVFTGSCTSEAVEAVVGEEGSELSHPVQLLLETLVETSLVQSQIMAGEMRFNLLETIREFALEQLTARGEEDDARQRHARYFLALAEQARPELIGPHQKDWFNRLSHEHANLRLALSWSQAHSIDINLRLAIALEQFWSVRGHLMEGRRWINEALRIDQNTPAETLAKALMVEGILTRLQGDYTEARELLDQSHTLFLQNEDAAGLAHVLYHLGMAAESQADYPSAQAYLQESLRLAHDLQDWDTEAGALSGLGYIASRLGDHALSRSHYEHALGIYQDHQNTRRAAATITNLGLCAYHQGNYQAARDYIDTALIFAREFEDHAMITLCLLHLGNIQIAQGDYAAARANLEENIARQRGQGDTQALPSQLGALGRVLHKLGDFTSARTRQVEALTLRAKAGDRRGVAVSLENLAQVELSEGKPGRGAHLLGAAEAIRESIGSPIIPARRLEYEQLVAELHTALGEGAFSQAWSEGRVLTIEQAVALALSGDDPSIESNS